MKFRLTLITFLLGTTFIAFAQLKLPEIISSGMVLQQNAEVNIWGWSEAKKEVIIEFGWLDKILKTKSNKAGKWSLKVQTPNADKVRYQLEVSSGSESILIENVVFGEVWLCSGQSNMEMPLSGFKGQPVEGSIKAITQSGNKWLRLFKAESNASLNLIDTLKGSTGWLASSPNTASKFSAIGYFFGSQLQQSLDVPVGLISSCSGGTPIEAWMSEDAHTFAKVIDLSELKWEDRKQKTATVLFNGMINPLIPFTIKGSLWYQGEANARENQLNYLKSLPAMVADWREKFESNFAFYFVQIAPFSYYNKEGLNTAWMRTIMVDAQKKIPNSGIVITTDLGAEWSIHPTRKKEIGDRLFYLAMNKTYGFESIDCEGPRYDRIEIEGDKIIIHFADNSIGLYAPQQEISGFEISGEDGVFRPAKAKIRRDRTTLEVWSDGLPNPIAVRYAWENYVEATLFDSSMLPASSFRTDD